MELIKTNFNGLFILQHKVFHDNRGIFVKTYNQEIFKYLNIDLEIKERYYTISNKNVIRGMHFQTPPHDHVKLVTVLNGKILDVILDIRMNSPTYGKYFSIYVEGSDGKTLYIPKGFAHGFKALADDTIVEYNQTTVYAPDCDAGILYNSFGFNWGINEPIISERDNNFESFENFNTPFL